MKQNFTLRILPEFRAEMEAQAKLEGRSLAGYIIHQLTKKAKK